MARMRLSAGEALLGMLAPMWQLVIGVLVLVVVVVSMHRLLLRGPSRMNRAVVVMGGAIIGVFLLGVLFSR
jgi:hypothetical protein